MKEQITPQSTLAAMIVGLIAIVAVWDVIAGCRGRTQDTVSHILGGWASEFPILGVFVGAVVGHIFWPRDGGP